MDGVDINYTEFNSKMKPLVSFCILAYNQESFIKDAVLAAMKQDYPNMEIIISDDCSTDNTYNVILETVNQYGESCCHKIVVNRNDSNLGIAENCNKVLYELAKGEYLILAGGDDISLPERASETVVCFEKFPNVTSLSFASEQVDVNLMPLPNQPLLLCLDSFSIFTLEDYIRFKDFVIFSGDSRAIRRVVVERFPPISIANAEDIFLFIRSLMLGSIAYIRKPLVKRRIHGKNVSTSRFNKRRWIKNKKQMMYDVDYAKQNQYITIETYNHLISKINLVSEYLYKTGIRKTLADSFPYLYKNYRWIKSFIWKRK